MNIKFALAVITLASTSAMAASNALVRYVCKQNFPASRDACEARLNEGQTKFLSAAAIEACMGASADATQQLNCVAGTINKNYALKTIADCRASTTVADCLAKAPARDGEVVAAASPHTVESAALAASQTPIPSPAPASTAAAIPAAASAKPASPSAAPAEEDPLAGLEDGSK